MQGRQRSKRKNSQRSSNSWFYCGGAAAGLMLHGTVFADPYVTNQYAAQDGDNLRIYVLDTVTYDDNLYRLSDDFGPASQIGEGASRDDVINRATLGGSARLFAGQQVFELKGNIDDNRFQENDRLDHTAGKAAAAWNYQLATRFSGAVGAEYTRALGDFAYTRTLEKDILDIQAYYLTTKIRVTPRWSLTGEGRTSRVDHSAPTSDIDTTETEKWQAGVMYETPRGDSFGFDYGESQNRLPDYDPPPGIVERDYHDKSVAAWMKYAYSVKTRFDLRVGYQDREYDHADTGDFSGTTGRAGMHWEPTAKTAFNLSIWRELQAYQEIGSEYFVGRGIKTDGVWRPTDKLQLSAGLSYEDHDFQSDGAVVPFVEGRDDKLTSGSVSATYTPRDWLDVSLTYQQQHRTSNRDLEDYDSHVVSLGGRIRF